MRKEVLWTTAEETLREIFLDGCEAAEEAVQESSYQFKKYVMTHLVPSGSLDSIFALNFDK